MKTESLSHWWGSGQVCCVSIPLDSLLPDRRHVVADLTNRLGGAGPHTGGRAAMHTLEEMCDCAAGEAGGCLQSEKFSVNLHRFCCDLGAVAFTQFGPSSQSTVQTLPDSKMILCLVKCSYAHNKSEEETLLPVSSHPSFLLTHFSIPISLAYLGLGRAGKRSHRVAQNLK